MYLVFTAPNCGRCNVVKNILLSKNVPFKEVNVAEGYQNLKLAQKYGVAIGGTIIDEDTGKTVMVEEIQ